MFSFSLRGIISVTMVMVCYLIPGTSPAQQWECLGLNSEWIETIAIDPSDDSIIYVGSANIFMNPDGIGGIFKSTNAGATWDTLLTEGISPSQLIVHPNNTQVIYSSLNSVNSSMPGVIKTTNGGNDWFWAGEGIEINVETGADPLAIDLMHPDTLYVGTGGFWDGSVFKTTNGGQNWVDIGEGVNDSDKTAIAIDPVHTQTIYVGCYGNGLLFKTTNGGIDWDQLSLEIAYGFNKLVINPNNSLCVFAAGDGFLHKSTDGGSTWLNPLFQDEELAARDLVFFPSNPDSLYLATSEGIYFSSDAGVSWNTMNSGIEDLRINTLAFTPSGDYLYCGSRDGGVFRLRINPDISIESPGVTNNSIWLSTNYPNPFSNFTTINYSLTLPNKVSLNVYDITGQFITTLVNARKMSGEHRFAWNGTDNVGHRLSPGTYLYQLKIGRYTETKRLTIVR